MTIAGVEVNVGETITLAEDGIEEPLETPPLAPPTLSMGFRAREGSSAKLQRRLDAECDNNVTLSVVHAGEWTTVFGRGDLQMGILVEELRREGHELLIAPPRIVADDEGNEPVEEVVVDVDEEYAGIVTTMLGDRGGALLSMDESGASNMRCTFEVPTRGLLGFSAEIARATHGSAVVSHLFLENRPPVALRGTALARGKLVAMEAGRVTAYALNSVKERGTLFVSPGDEVFVGQVVGESSRPDDELDVNVCRAKAVDNMRTVLKDEKFVIPPPVSRTVEEYLAYMDLDELVEVTPEKVVLRKEELDAGNAKGAKEK